MLLDSNSNAATMACVDVNVFNSYICLDIFVAAGDVGITDVAEVTAARPSAGNFTDSLLVLFHFHDSLAISFICHFSWSWEVFRMTFLHVRLVGIELPDTE